MKTSHEIRQITGCTKGSISQYTKKGILIVEGKVGNTFHYSDKSVKAFTKLYLEGLEHNLPKDKKGKVDLKNRPKKENIQKTKENLEKSSLDSVGSRVMAEAIDELKSIGIYRPHDNYAIYDYAMAYQLYQTFINDVNKQTKLGKISLYTNLATTYSKIVDDKRKRLGIDPNSRASLPTTDKAPVDEMDGLLDG